LESRAKWIRWRPPHVDERLLNHRLGSIKTVTILTDVAEVYHLASYLQEMRQAIIVRESKLESLLRSAQAA